MKIVKGDLLEMGKRREFDIIVHGCNCFNTMGSGIARQIREDMPDAWIADQETIAGDPGKLHTYTLGMHGALVIVNAYTQYSVSKQGEDVFEYNSFQTILNKLAKRLGKWRFGFPMIGMGLANGDAERILAMLEDFSQKVEAQGGSVTLVEYQP
jgi:O-acetyl-ADP-ribose deacetylase (regulator of RNase III)